MLRHCIFSLLAVSAVAAQAATVKWNGGTFYEPGKDGAYTTTSLGKDDAMGYLWEVDAATYAKYSGANISKIYTDYSSKISTATAKKGSMSSGAINLSGTTEWAVDSTAYAILLYTYDDGDNQWYVANAAKYDGVGTSTATVTELGHYIGGKIGTEHGAAITGWTTASVPEPFSGTLVLVGMAGLALRRKLKKQKKA